MTDCPEHGNTLVRDGDRVECCIKDCPWQRLHDAGMAELAAVIQQQAAVPAFGIIPRHQEVPE